MSDAASAYDPWKDFDTWLSEAKNLPDFDAMALATASKNATPSVRFVLFKGRNTQSIFFYSNYESRKAQELNENPRASVAFYWSSLNRQIRMSGVVEKLSSEESNAYFATRPRASQLGARVSKQSKTLRSKENFIEELELEQNSWIGKEVARPESWGGYALTPHSIEFWQGQKNRLHDRELYEKVEGIWKKRLLYP